MLSYAILSVLASEPCSGYDLAKRFDKSVEGSIGFFWNATYQQIYRELAKLEEKSWITAEIVHQEHRPDKRLYELTERGREHLREWIGANENAATIKDELLVKLFGGYLVGEEVMMAKLERHARQHQQRLKIYEEIERQYFAEPELFNGEKRSHYLTLRCGIHYERGWLTWYEEARAFLQVDRR